MKYHNKATITNIDIANDTNEDGDNKRIQNKI
jgi:hypothetical protein